MKILLFVVIAVLGLLVLLWVVGLLIPRDHVASRTTRFSQSPEAVWKLLSDFPAYSKWAPGVSGVRRLPDRNGHPLWALEGKWPMPLEVEASEPLRCLVTRIADPHMPFGGTWTWEVAADGAGTRVTVTERGFIRPALFRALTRLFFGYTSTMDAYLKAMGKHFNEAPTPGPGTPGA